MFCTSLFQYAIAQMFLRFFKTEPELDDDEYKLSIANGEEGDIVMPKKDSEAENILDGFDIVKMSMVCTTLLAYAS